MVLQIKAPILGFEALQSVVMKKVDDLFSTLHATNDSEISFSVVNPFKLIESYEIEIPDSIKLLLEIGTDTKISVYCMVMLSDPKEKSTINLLAPLIVNDDKKLMAQIALHPNDYPDYGLQEPISRFM